jgi:multidrug transporter EmrE-like cation transporter
VLVSVFVNVLGIGYMSATAYAIFYAIAVAFFVLAGIGAKPFGERVHPLGLGLAIAFFPIAWNAFADPRFLN